MRQYRGKQIDNGEWVYGWYFELIGERGRVDSYILDKPEYEFAALEELDCVTGFVEVNPATVGQSTGLRDKNGKEIFESDVWQAGTGHKFAVVWTGGGFALEGLGSRITMVQGQTGEIIGNIHDKEEDNG